MPLAISCYHYLLKAHVSIIAPGYHPCHLAGAKLVIVVIWSISGFSIISITLLAFAAPDFQPPGFVFKKFVNETGCTLAPFFRG